MDFELTDWLVDPDADNLNTSLFGPGNTNKKVKKRKKSSLEKMPTDETVLKKAKKNSHKKLERKLTFTEAVDSDGILHCDSDGADDELDISKISKKKRKHMKEKKRRMRKLSKTDESNSGNLVVDKYTSIELLDKNVDKNKDTENIEKSKDLKVKKKKKKEHSVEEQKKSLERTVEKPSHLHDNMNIVESKMKNRKKKKKSFLVKEETGDKEKILNCSPREAKTGFIHDESAIKKKRKRKNDIEVCGTPEKKKKSSRNGVETSESTQHNESSKNELNISDDIGASSAKRAKKKKKKSSKKNKYKYLDILRSTGNGEVFVHAEHGKTADHNKMDLGNDQDNPQMKLFPQKKAITASADYDKISKKKKLKCDTESMKLHAEDEECSEKRKKKKKKKENEESPTDRLKFVKNEESRSEINLTMVEPDVKSGKKQRSKMSRSFNAEHLKRLLIQNTSKNMSEKQTNKLDDEAETDHDITLGEQKQFREKNSGKKKWGDLSLKERMTEQLNAARFRFLNQQLYSQTGKEAMRLFQEDEEAFKVYHEGFQAQVGKWPSNPVDIIIQQIMKCGASLVVADFGCGDAKIARSVPCKVHSFDLVALNEHVTVCDIAKVPLRSGSVNIAVFCLSLMGTNSTDYLKEANRVLKQNGILKIAEVTSRITDMDTFVSQVESLGFKLVKKDVSNTMFVMMDFKKVGQTKKKKAIEVELDPCVYKRR